MIDRLCFYHITVPAEGMCIHCHKPYCAACKVETHYGKFCCFDCSGKYAAFKSSWKEPKLRTPWLGALVSGFVVLAVLAEVLAIAGHRWLGISALAPFDLISRFLR